MSTPPGRSPANIRASLDGTKVTNYAQWYSVEDYEAALSDPDARPHVQSAAELAISFEPTHCTVAYTRENG